MSGRRAKAIRKWARNNFTPQLAARGWTFTRFYRAAKRTWTRTPKP